MSTINILHTHLDRMTSEPIALRSSAPASIGVSLNGGLCMSVNIEADGRPGTVWSAFRCNGGVRAEGASADEAVRGLKAREKHLDAAGRALSAAGLDAKVFLGGLTVEAAGTYAGYVELTHDLKCRVITHCRQDVVTVALKAAGIALA